LQIDGKLISHPSIDKWPKNNTYNDIFNLGSGEKTTIKELLEVIKHEGNFKHNIKVEDGIIGDMIGCVSNNTKLKIALDNNFKLLFLLNKLRILK